VVDELVANVREGGALLRGTSKPSRTMNYQLSQDESAALLGISVGTLRNCEQGRRTPEGPARVLLQVAAQHPETVGDVVRPTARP
jgi:putative transcriptional regulator